MDRQQIGQFIQAVRKQKKLTQQQLAIDCQLSRDTIINVERGNVNITIDALLSILNVLSASIEIKQVSTITYDIETLPAGKVIVVNDKEPNTIYIYDFSKVEIAQTEETNSPPPKKQRIAKTIKYNW